MDLIELVVEDDVKGVRELLQNNEVDINIQDENGNSSLHYAVLLPSENMVYLLCEKGIDVDIINKDKISALHIAAEYNLINIFIHITINGGAYDFISVDNNTPLDIAVKYDNKAVKDYIDELDDFYKSCEENKIKKIKDHINNGISPNIRFGENKYTALHYLTVRGSRNIDIIKFIVENGGDIDIKTKKLETALHYAIKNEHKDLIMLYLQFANIKIRGPDNGSYLHYAISNNSSNEIIKLLFKYGINPYIEDKNNKIAYEIKNKPIVKKYMNLYERSKKDNKYDIWIKEFVKKDFKWALDRIINKIKIEAISEYLE
jgi:ankyrin repeat protein